MFGVTKEVVEYYRQKYQGKTIIIDNMVGEPDYCGKVGKVDLVDSIGQLHGTWGGLSVNVTEDSFHIVDEEDK